LLRVEHPEPVEVFVARNLQYSEVMGVCHRLADRSWIELAGEADDSQAEATIAHELVHAWVDPKYLALPESVREGFAQYVAHLVQPAATAPERLGAAATIMRLGRPYTQFVRKGLVAVFWEDDFPVEVKLDTTCIVFYPSFDVARVPPPRVALSSPLSHVGVGTRGSFLGVQYAIGLLVVRRIGLDVLEDLCDSSRFQGHSGVSAEVLFTAAGLDPDSYNSWATAAASLVTGDDVTSIVTTHALKAHRAERARIGDGSQP
jgi:hypothetical protein